MKNIKDSERVFNAFPETPTNVDFFLLASPGRTGSTLLTHLLGQHPEISMLSEPYLIRAERSMQPEKINELYRLLKYSWSELSSTPWIGIAEKTGTHYDHVSTFLTNNIVQIVRDPRDAFASAKNMWFSVDSTNNRFREPWEYLDAFLDQIEWCKRHKESGKPLNVVKYEDLVESPVSTLTQVFCFLGIECSSELVEQVLINAAAAEAVLRGDPNIVKRGGSIDTSSVGRWMNDLTTGEVELVLEYLGDYMKTMGYQ